MSTSKIIMTVTTAIMLIMTGCAKDAEESESIPVVKEIVYSQEYYDTHDIYTIIKDGIEYTVITPKEPPPVIDIVLPKHMEYLKSQLSISDYELFMFLKKSFADFEEIIKITDMNITEEELSRVYNLYLNNELGITLTKSIRYKVQNGYIREIYPEYAYSKNNLNRLNYDVTDQVAKVKQVITNEGSTDYEIVKQIHDYIIRHCAYEKGSNANDLYGVLFTRKAVCEGYAKAFSYFCNEYDIESIIVTGKTIDDNHMWNKVKIDNVWYNIDLTWDDADNVLSYDYFLVSDGVIAKTHSEDKRFDYPAALVNYVQRDSSG